MYLFNIRRPLCVGTFTLAAAGLWNCSGASTGGTSTIPSSPLQPSTVTTSAVQSVTAVSPVAPASLQRTTTTSTFSPAQISGLAAWYDGADSATIAQMNGRVSRWLDRSGHGADLVSTSVAAGPGVKAAALNGLSMLSFDGRSLLASVNKTFSSNVLNESTVVFVADEQDATQTSAVLWSGAYFSDPRWTVRLSEHGASHFDLNNSSDGRLTSNASPAGPSVWTAGGSVGKHHEFLSKNGTVIASSNGPSAPASGSAPLLVGGMTDGTRYAYGYTGQLAEVVVFARLLTSAETAEIEGYLACKWALQSALPGSHPYRSVCPGVPAASPTPAATPTPLATPTPVALKIPNHVLTADYVSPGNGGYGGPATTIAKYATWAADPSLSNAATYAAAGMKVYAYMDPDRAYTNVNDYTYQDITGTNRSALAKTCSGAIVTSRSGAGVITDPRQPAAQAHLNNIVNNRANAVASLHWDAWFLDDFDDLLNLDNSACNATASSSQAASIAMIENSSPTVKKYILNTLDIGADGQQLPDVKASSVIGAMMEECYIYPGIGLQGIGSFRDWTTTENYELSIATLKKNFWCFANMGESPSTAKGNADRAFIYASFLLTYDLGTSILEWAGASTPSSAQVMPEAQIVATEPLVSAPSSVAGLQSASGVYVREYRSCYRAGELLGPCAAIVNPDRSSARAVPALTQTYRHSISFNGSDSIDGGTVGTTGAVPTTLPALSGTVLF